MFFAENYEVSLRKHESLGSSSVSYFPFYFRNRKIIYEAKTQQISICLQIDDSDVRDYCFCNKFNKFFSCVSTQRSAPLVKDRRKR
jgi:hypothetical protein